MDIGLVQLPLYTGAATAVLMVVQLVLMWRVISFRGQSEVLIGTGGVDEMEQRIRVHANFLENTPMFLIGLALAEMVGGSSIWVLALAAAFVAARLGHAIGFSMSPGVTMGRLIGTLVTMLSILATGVLLAYLVFQKL